MIKCLCVPSKTGMEGGLDQGQILTMLSPDYSGNTVLDNSNNLGLLLNFIFSRKKYKKLYLNPF